MINRIILIVLYSLTIASVFLLIVTVGDYYSASRLDRPHSPLHLFWKPGGLYGHGLGVVGSALMIMLLLYTLRKNAKFMNNWGSLQTWLNYHIWMGITGPILVTFHTAFKFGGIVAISFWSMTAVALSGFLGRYLYIQIPRSKTGKAMSASEMQDIDAQFASNLQKFGLKENQIARFMQLSSESQTRPQNNLSGLIYILTQDITLPFKLKRYKKEVSHSLKISASDRKRLMKLVRNRILFLRRLKFLKTSHQLLHYWHVIHRPFALVMLLIMVIHVIVTILFGYRWIF